MNSAAPADPAIAGIGGNAPVVVVTAADSRLRTARLAPAVTAKVRMVLAAAAAHSAISWPPNARPRPCACSSVVRSVPLLQSPPAISAPSTISGTWAVSAYCDTAMIEN